MSNLSVQLNAASIQVIDTGNAAYPNAYRVNSPVGDITLSASKAFYGSYVVSASGAGTAVPLPATTVWFVYVKNLDAAANLTIQLQATGGSLPSAANSPIIVPGGVFIIGNPTEGAGGFTALTIISSVGNTAAEVLVAA